MVHPSQRVSLEPVIAILEELDHGLKAFSWWILGWARLPLILLPPHVLPLAKSIAASASVVVLNLTKPNPHFFPVLRSTGRKESMILPALQNIASSSVLDISTGKLDANSGTKSYRSDNMRSESNFSFAHFSAGHSLSKSLVAMDWAASLPLALAITPNRTLSIFF